MRKIFEFILFIILNVLLTPFFISFLTLFFSMKFYDYLDSDVYFYIYSFIIILFRISVFPFLYMNSQKIYNIKIFLDKIKNNKKLLFVTIIFAFLCDYLSLFLTTDKSISYSFTQYLFVLKYSYIFSGGGLLISYLSFFIWVKYIMPKYKTNTKLFNIIFWILFIFFIVPIIFVLFNILIVICS